MSSERKELNIYRPTYIQRLFSSLAHQNQIHTDTNILVISENDDLQSTFCRRLATLLDVNNDFECKDKAIVYLNYNEDIAAKVKGDALSSHRSIFVAHKQSDLEDTLTDTVEDIIELISSNNQPTVFIVDGLIFEHRRNPDLQPLIHHCLENNIMLVVSNRVENNLDVTFSDFDYLVELSLDDTSQPDAERPVALSLSNKTETIRLVCPRDEFHSFNDCL